MSKRVCVVLLVAVARVCVLPAYADVFRWDDGQLIPGTEGVEPGPRVKLDHRDLAFADLAGRDLTLADFSMSNLAHATLREATVAIADLSGAVITQVDFFSVVGLTKEQLYSTQSYQERNLQGIGLVQNRLIGWNFSQQDLTGANLGLSELDFADLSGANLTNADLSASLDNTDFTGAIVAGTRLIDTTSQGFTKDQLYSTASYEMKQLPGISLVGNDLTGWNFADQNLSGASFYTATLTDAELNEANLRGATFGQAKLTRAGLNRADLANADFRSASLVDADLRGANLKNTCFVEETGENGADLSGTKFSSETMYNQWTSFPSGIDPELLGLTFMAAVAGDFDANEILDANDVDFYALYDHQASMCQPTGMLDLNNDKVVNALDQQIWVKNLQNTYFGDANLDGEFNSADLVEVLSAGKYEQRYPGGADVAAGWAEGDWNADGVFESGDLIRAFQDGGYELGPAPEVVVVPEPATLLLLVAGLLLVRKHGWRRRI
jgi:uncharacterized protein YjbI with pentapeptide repeats